MVELQTLAHYAFVMLAILLFNSLAMPWIVGQQVKEVDYGTFMTMIDEKNIGLVEISEAENQITFTDKEEKQVYKTAMVEDPTRTQRLYEAGAKFSGQFVEEPNWLLSFLLTWVLPAVIFVVIGQVVSKKMMDRAGGPNSMSFNMGKSNAKVYVKSMWRVLTRQRKAWLKSLTICMTPVSTRKSVLPCRRVCCL